MATTPSGTACNPTRGVTDYEKPLHAKIMDALAVAVAVINTKAAIEMAMLQKEIADDYLEIAKWWNNFHKEVYRPCEDQELREACGAEFYEPDYDNAVGRATAQAKFLAKNSVQNAIRCSQSYATGLQQGLARDVLVAAAVQESLLANLGYKNERAYKHAKDDVRWKRREQVLNRGRDLMAANVSISQMSHGIYGSLGQQAGAGVGGALGWLGYSMNRRWGLTAPPARAPQAPSGRMAATEQPVSTVQTFGVSDSYGDVQVLNDPFIPLTPGRK